jgi:hypothetical protein
MQGRLEILDAFEIVDQYFSEMRDRSVITQAALVDLTEFEHNYRFFEDVAVNRNFNLRIFSDPDKALEWLKG